MVERTEEFKEAKPLLMALDAKLIADADKFSNTGFESRSFVTSSRGISESIRWILRSGILQMKLVG